MRNRRQGRGRLVARMLAPLALGACTPTLPPPLPPSVAVTRFALPENFAFSAAVERGTRTRDGRPGPRYWQQWAEYDLEATLDPRQRRVLGRGTIRYLNRSPDTLRTVAVHLHQNLTAPGAPGTRTVPRTEGMIIDTVRAQGRTLEPRNLAATTGPGYEVSGTIAWLRLADPIAPGASAELAFAWRFTVPPPSTPRMGTDGEVFLIGYWYPQMAVYDDVTGWHTDPYLGTGEFYMGYANYEVSVTVPSGYLVPATGVLVNAPEVLSDSARARLARSRRAPGVVAIVTARDRGEGGATARGQGGTLTWRLQADSVRDFIWNASDRYLWDATVAVAGDHTGDGRPDTAAIHAFYRPEANDWRESARYTRHAIESLSRYLWPYPWPHMTSVEGFVFGMEYPMLTLVGDPGDPTFLYRIIAHEVGHMWFPMLVGSDEKRRAWQDEGFAQFLEGVATVAFTNGRVDPALESMQNYIAFVRAGGEAPLMRHADEYPAEDAYAVAAYDKSAVVLRALRAVIGAERFDAALREYGRAWTGKHPHAYDFFHAMNAAAGEDLSWFWRGWFFETWELDQAIASVVSVGDSVSITIESRGEMPMPVPLAIGRADGTSQRITVPVNVWLEGQRRTTVRVASSPALSSVVIDAEGMFPDVNRGNQTWRP